MGKEEIVNAKITSTFLGIERGFLTFNIFVNLRILLVKVHVHLVVVLWVCIMIILLRVIVMRQNLYTEFLIA